MCAKQKEADKDNEFFVCSHAVECKLRGKAVMGGDSSTVLPCAHAAKHKVGYETDVFRIETCERTSENWGCPREFGQTKCECVKR